MKEFLKAEDIQIGSWWAAADGSKYGCCVMGVDIKWKTVHVLYTDGKQRADLDAFKLQYRYYLVTPNKFRICKKCEKNFAKEKSWLCPKCEKELEKELK